MTMRPPHALALVLLAIHGAGNLSFLAAQQRDTALVGVWRFLEEVDRRADSSLSKAGPPLATAVRPRS